MIILDSDKHHEENKAGYRDPERGCLAVSVKGVRECLLEEVTIGPKT